MEITERQLRRMAADVDELHHESLGAMADDLRDLHAETRRFRKDRRRLLTAAGAGGLALGVGSSVWPFTPLVAAFGQEGNDGDVAGFAESIELAVVAAYTTAAQSGKLQPAVKDVGVLFARHHQAHADAFGGAAGPTATNKANPKLLEELGPRLAAAIEAGQAKILELAIDLENGAAATYLFALGVLRTPAALKLTASILPVESQHATVLAIALGRSGKDLFPTDARETDAKKLDPAAYPPSA